MIDTTKTLKDPNAPIGAAGLMANVNYYMALSNMHHEQMRMYNQEIYFTTQSLYLDEDDNV